ncbi:MAG: phosphonate ABC transporter ATP-binding protein [Candidatus Sericytochromatia bacterium]|nr:phosphonate ABC transporter ATP-binding protein [Candidatus Sericytochromatia bacterium]
MTRQPTSILLPQDLDLLRVSGLHKAYPGGQEVLKGVDLSFRPGEFVAILGLSGAGKSTFLRCINRLVEPTSGRILVPGKVVDRPDEAIIDITRIGRRDLQRWRRRVGMVFQQFNLAKRLTVLENVLSGSLGYADPLLSSLRMFSEQERARALRNLDRVGLLPLAYQRADAISGGQQQRVAIARALMQCPALILGDEPVASLDPKLSLSILELMRTICREDGITVLVCLHVLDLARRFADRVVGFAGGQVVFDGGPDRLDEASIRRIYQARTEELRGFTA